MRVVIALGGNALLERGEKPDADIQDKHVVRAVDALAPLASSHQLMITHGNGPQVGVLAPCPGYLLAGRVELPPVLGLQPRAPPGQRDKSRATLSNRCRSSAGPVTNSQCRWRGSRRLLACGRGRAVHWAQDQHHGRSP